MIIFVAKSNFVLIRPLTTPPARRYDIHKNKAHFFACKIKNNDTIPTSERTRVIIPIVGENIILVKLEITPPTPKNMMLIHINPTINQ